MLNILKDCSTFAYADDTAIIVSHKNIDSACEIMQKQLNEVSKWCHDNGLVINSSKTKIMHIKPPHLGNTNINIMFHSYQCLHKIYNTNDSETCTCTTTLELVKSIKYLGVYIDDKFKWLTQIQKLSKKLRKAAYSLYHLSNCSTYDVLKQAYFSLAESYIRHGITAWGNSTYCKSLQQTQNQILKTLLKSKNHNQQLQISLIYENPNNSHNWPNNTNQDNINTRNSNVTNDVNTNFIGPNNNNSNTSSIHNNLFDNFLYNTNSNNFNNSTSSNNILSNYVIYPRNANGINNNTNTHNINNTNNVLNNTPHNYIRIHNINSNSINIAHNNNTNSTNSDINNTNPCINSTNNIASTLQILNIKSLYYYTLINEFYNNPRFLKPISHVYNTRKRAEGRFKVERHNNNYGKNSLNTALPNLFNKLPLYLLNINNIHKRKSLIKTHFIATQ